MFLYRNILKKSLALTWRHKYLWFFGLFASLLSGAGRYNMSFSRMSKDWSSNYFANFARLVRTGVLNGDILSNIGLLFRQDPISTTIYLVFSLIIVVLSLFLLWLVIVSQIGLINNSAKIIKNNKKKKTTIKEGVEAGTKSFWPVLGLNLVINTLICFLAILIGLPLIFITIRSGGGIELLYFILFIIFIPIALILSFLLKYAICFIVIRGRSFINSIGDAWRLFVKNWLISIEMAFILFFIDILFVMVLGLVVLVLAIPYLFIAFGLSSLISLNLFWVMFVLGIVLAIFLVIVAGSMLTCFKLVAWTDLFINLTGRGGLSKIIRFAEGIKK